MGAYAPVGRGTGFVDLAAVTRAELYSQARQLGIPGRSRMNKEELARALRERPRQAVQAAARRRSRPWRSLRLIPPLAVVMLSAAIGATTPMLLVDSPGELGDMLRAELPTASVQPAFAQPGRVAEAAGQDGATSSRPAAPTIVLAEASGDSATGSAPLAGDTGTETPPGDFEPTPAGPPAGDGDQPGGESDDPGGGGGNPGDDGGSGEDDLPDEAGPHEDSDGDDEGKDKGKGNGNGEGKGNGKGGDEDRGNGQGKGNGEAKGKGKDGEEGEG
jgi:Rho termination factor, N-terminal domain